MSANPDKRANQTRRAQKLVAQFIIKMQELGTTDRRLQAKAAKLAKTFVWDALAEEIPNFGHPPSSETIAVAVTMMEGRAKANDIYYRRNPGLKGLMV